MHKKSSWTAVIVGAAALLTASCKSGPKISGDTAALVNQSEIKISEVDRVFRNRIKQTSQNPALEEASTLKLNILGQLIMDQILMERAAKRQALFHPDDSLVVKPVLELAKAG